ncbi:uncharacterized protein LOC124257084 isoform X2 [Haliotis rubra]|uniref:uncharacterized protein LOC124257084 isoform X2 n=1 Tax=Haliotis rubra TaxID=36100 RepID=UPI001EE6333B|nr:uncharacterized protein LOC124257084 isoform X2 [Haliotis rubra]
MVNVRVPVRCSCENTAQKDSRYLTPWFKLTPKGNTVVEVRLDACSSIRLQLGIYTGGTGKMQADENSTFHSSCHPASWSSAASSCEETHGTIFSIYDLRTRRGGQEVQDALRDHGELWIQNNWTDWSNTTNGYDCATIVNGSITFTQTNCSALRHYLCISNDSSQCVQTTTMPWIFESSTFNQTSPTPPAADTSPSVTMVCVLVGMLLFAIAVISVVIIKMRKRRFLHNTSSMNASLTTVSSVPEYDPDLQPESPMIFYTGSSFGENMYTAAVDQIQADYYNMIDDFTTDQQPSMSLTSSIPTTARVQGPCAYPSDRKCGESSNSYYEIQGDRSTKCTDSSCYKGEGRQSVLSTSGLYSEIDDNGTDTDIRGVQPDHYAYLHALNRASEAPSLTNSGIYDIPNDPATDSHDRRQLVSGEYAVPYACSDGLNTNLHLPESLDDKCTQQSARSSLLSRCSTEPNHYDTPNDL